MVLLPKMIKASSENFFVGRADYPAPWKINDLKQCISPNIHWVYLCRTAIRIELKVSWSKIYYCGAALAAGKLALSNPMPLCVDMP